MQGGSVLSEVQRCFSELCHIVNRVGVVEAGTDEDTSYHFGHVFRNGGMYTCLLQCMDMLMYELANGIDMVIHRQVFIESNAKEYSKLLLASDRLICN